MVQDFSKDQTPKHKYVKCMKCSQHLRVDHAGVPDGATCGLPAESGANSNRGLPGAGNRCGGALVEISAQAADSAKRKSDGAA